MIVFKLCRGGCFESSISQQNGGQDKNPWGSEQTTTCTRAGYVSKAKHKQDLCWLVTTTACDSCIGRGMIELIPSIAPFK
jgi:hypothetical protein